ncbi:ABC transporter permease [Algisphaera agarilytica]|uniref:Peptide/nickel transport system permease protein n=1 Tax=Algisphaera agarilytica TaxID=1385975 RepID=A0A7X0LM30_9BACT|nr:ABC transporter permease [Algisphaera agarilytica]MBB6430593.1 peptide/nickel transport system permease protein [Algisphaera agarilytica]
MTKAVTPTATEEEAVEKAPLPRSLSGQVGLRLIGQWGARIGLAWIATLILLAVFAPVLASSHPFVWKVDGKVSSPWLEHLSAVDVVLLLSLFLAVVLLALRKFAVGTRLAVWAWITTLLAGVAAGRSAMTLWSRQQDDGPGLVFVLVIIMLVGLMGLLVAIPWLSSATKRLKLAVGVIGVVVAGGFWFADVSPPANIVYSQYREATVAGQVEWQVLPPLAFSPNDYQRDTMSATGVDPRLAKPTLAHPLGTDESGADVLSRMIHATRIALAIGLIATGIAVALGILVGGLMGYFAGWVDLLGMRLVEIFSAIPVIFLLIMIVAFYGRNLYLMMVIIGVTGWVGYAIFIRAEFLKLRKMDYVQAAHACGTPLWSILFRHMLPNGVTPVLVLASFGIASAILTESTLSFLGLGLVEEPSWGQLLNQARRADGQWGLTWFPGLAIFLTVFAYNLVGEAMRDALDPRSAD